MNKSQRPMAFLSLGLLVAALLGPFVIAAFGRNEAPALGFGFTAGFLSLTFAVVSRSEKIGRSVLVIMLALLIAGAGSIPVIRAVLSRAVTRERAKLEREQNAIKHSVLMEEQRERNLKSQAALSETPSVPAESKGRRSK
jgi:hypothetical protein